MSKRTCSLAYYLTTRHIDESATEANVVAACQSVGEPGTTKARIIRQSRNPFTNVVELELDAHVEGDPGAAHYCPGCLLVAKEA